MASMPSCRKPQPLVISRFLLSIAAAAAILVSCIIPPTHSHDVPCSGSSDGSATVMNRAANILTCERRSRLVISTMPLDCVATVRTMRNSSISEMYFHWKVDYASNMLNMAIETFDLIPPDFITSGLWMALGFPENCTARENAWNDVRNGGKPARIPNCKPYPTKGAALQYANGAWDLVKYGFSGQEGTTAILSDFTGSRIGTRGYEVGGDRAVFGVTKRLRDRDDLYVITPQDLTSFVWMYGTVNPDSSLEFTGEANRGTFSAILDSTYTTERL